MTLFAFIPTVAGCTTSPLSNSWGPPVESSRRVSMLHDTRTAEPSSSADAIDLPAELRLPEAIAIAMHHHPELAAFSAAQRAREAEILQASLLPNPELEFEIEEILGSGERRAFNAAEYTLRIAHLFEVGDKRRQRTNLAERMAEETELEYLAARAAVAAGVTRTFVETLLAQEHRVLAEEHHEFLRQLVEVIEHRIRAGAASPIERHRAVVELNQAQAAMQRATKRMQMHTRLVPFAIGLATGESVAVLGALEQVSEPIDRDRIEQLVRETPQLERWMREIARRRAEVELARANAIPDVRASAGIHYFSEPDDVAFSFGVSVPLMVFDRNRGAIESRAWEVRSAKERRRAAELSMLAAATRLHAEIETALTDIRAIERDILPAAERATRDIETAFAEGKIDLLSALDTQRMLFEIRDQLLEARARYHIGVAELDALLGRYPGGSESMTTHSPDEGQE